MEIPFILKKVAIGCNHIFQAAPESTTGVIHLHTQLYAEMPLFISSQRVLGVAGLPIGECLNVGLLFLVLSQVTYP